MKRMRRSRQAFTLVELLVVIGIIAVLIGILVPVLAGVQARGRDIKCQSNMRQILQGIMTYAAENKGCMPWGFVWNRSKDRVHPDPANPTNTWEEASDNPNHEYISWAGLVGRAMTRKGSGIDDDFSTDIFLNFPPVFRCPEAEQVYPHVVSYALNWIVGISPWYELGIGARPPRAQLRPPPITSMLKETALIWDTAIQPGWELNTGFLLGADIDGQRFWEGAEAPQLRYFSIKDPFSRLPGGFGNNYPVKMNTGSFTWYNIDPKAGTHYPYQGNLRFRHQKGKACNVGWADGHVSQFTVRYLPDGTANNTHDALRRYFMIKWPPGVPPDTGRPH